MNRHHAPAVILFGLMILLFAAAPAAAQKKKAPLQANPGAPTLTVVQPAAGQRGTTVEWTLTGAKLANPTNLWTDIPGAKVVIPNDRNNGKNAAALRVRVEVPKETPLGFYGVRLATRGGISNLQLVCIDDLPVVLESGTNHAKTSAQALSVPCGVAARADAETSDFFKVSVRASQRLSFEVIGHRLGSAFDPQITIHDARSGRELKGGHDNDARGLQTDARLTYTFKEAGDYLVEVRDTTFRGGADFVYYLRIGDYPCATAPLPLALRRGTKGTIHFTGTQVEGVSPIEVTAPADPLAAVVWVTPRGPSGLPGWPVALTLSDLDEVLEQEPNNEPGKASRVPVPGAVTGRIQDRGDVDTFVFKAVKGQRLIVEAQTHALYSPAEVYMVLKDARGKDLLRTNPVAAARLDFTPPADGDYFLHVEHLHNSYFGGPTEAYRVRIVPAAPDFSLAAGLDRYDAPQGVSAVVPLSVVRAGYMGPIDVALSGGKGLSGQAVIPANQTSALLAITAAPDAPLGAQGVTIQGKAVINGKTVLRTVQIDSALSAGLGGLIHPPLQYRYQIGVGVTEKPPFTLALRFDPPEVLHGGKTVVTVTATRSPGFNDEIKLTPLGLPANVAPVLKNIAKNANEAKIELKPTAKALAGSFAIAFVGKAKFQKSEFLVTGGPGILVVTLPFELRVEPTAIMLPPGAKARVQVHAVRKAGYQGPIAVELQGLPPNVTAGKATIAAGQTQTAIELTVAGNAAPAAPAAVRALGTAGKQKNRSASFAVTIVKK